MPKNHHIIWYPQIDGIFNIGSVNHCNKFDFVESVCKAINLKPKLKKNEIFSSIRPRYSVLSCKKIKTVLKFECDWEKELISYIKKRYSC